MATAVRSVTGPKAEFKKVTSAKTYRRNATSSVGEADTQHRHDLANSVPALMSPAMLSAREEDLEAARTVSSVLFGVLTVGITIGVIGFVCSFLFT